MVYEYWRYKYEGTDRYPIWKGFGGRRCHCHLRSSVAVECFGIVGMAAVNMKDGLVKLLKRDYLTHGISVTIEDENLINIDFHVIVAYGVSICTVSDNLIETVKYKVESFTGMKINKINIYVEGVRVID